MLNGLDILGLQPFISLGNGELDFLTFGEGFETFCFNRTEVRKNIGAGFLFDKTESLGVVKPLDRTGSYFRHKKYQL